MEGKDLPVAKRTSRIFPELTRSDFLRNELLAIRSKLSATEESFQIGAILKIIRFPNSPFELHQPFEAAGDQPQAIKELVEGIEDGLTAQTLLGVTGSGKTYTMANVIARTGLPTLIMAPNKNPLPPSSMRK